MNVLLVSQCSKRALPETRRVLDQFAERKGDRVWQTAITNQGLVTLRKMLRKTARRNTAVSCHWIRGKNHTEVLWFVGNLRRYNEQGSAPTNTTANDILRSGDENQWHTVNGIAILAAIAGLFHDFGKANNLFQKKLSPNVKGRISEPYRHEWVSLRLFEAFVGSDTDEQWLVRLHNLPEDTESVILNRMTTDTNHPKRSSNPFNTLPSLARAVGWLIISHHRLPKLINKEHEADIEKIDLWLTSRKTFKPYWNSPQCEYDDWTQADWEEVWRFKHGTPVCSFNWRNKAQSIAKRAIKLNGFTEKDWLLDCFSMHLARLSLMLADHTYSAGAEQKEWQDKLYKANANTKIDQATQKKVIRQKLDEHNIGVCQNAYLLANNLPNLRTTLPAIGRHKKFKQRASDPRFRWQDRAYDIASSIKERTYTQGFFGVNMASTGCGKTFANARIMYGLADERKGCRFSVALGLRTLTLQTGDALRERLDLATDDLAVLIGSAAVRELHEKNVDGSRVDGSSMEKRSTNGSESSDELFEEHQYVRYDGSLDDGRLSEWLKQTPKLQQLLSAPVLVCTIDHLMPATDGDRGGKQIAPMLRLLTSDLVLDEPDDFNLEDLPALARLVNWAGMLGSRVLLSSATLTPSISSALFEAYRTGRQEYNKVVGERTDARGICCAWFDEFRCDQKDLDDIQSFVQSHNHFTSKRAAKLAKEPVLRIAEILPVTSNAAVESVIHNFAETISAGFHKLHQNHHQVEPGTGKKVSVGLVRMANINSLVETSKEITSIEPEGDCCVHFVVYHSQFPMIVRSSIEQVLDQTLTRHKSEALWQVPSIKAALASTSKKNNIFVVLATAVAEVGRDHDYDWIVAEPSSMRSIIQLAGRLQRHRHKVPDTTNYYILSHNFRALRGIPSAYAKPGFESKNYALQSHDLNHILKKELYEHVNASPRIIENSVLEPAHSLVDLEHSHMRGKLFGDSARQMNVYAALWWESEAKWCAELQRLMPFRSSAPSEEFLFLLEDEGDDAEIQQVHDNGEVKPASSRFEKNEMEFAKGCRPWVVFRVEDLIETEAEAAGIDYSIASHRFARLSLPKNHADNVQTWRLSSIFGAWRGF